MTTPAEPRNLAFAHMRKLRSLRCTAAFSPRPVCDGEQLQRTAEQIVATRRGKYSRPAQHLTTESEGRNTTKSHDELPARATNHTTNLYAHLGLFCGDRTLRLKVALVSYQQLVHVFARIPLK